MKQVFIRLLMLTETEAEELVKGIEEAKALGIDIKINIDIKVEAPKP